MWFLELCRAVGGPEREGAAGCACGGNPCVCRRVLASELAAAVCSQRRSGLFCDSAKLN